MLTQLDNHGKLISVVKLTSKTTQKNINHFQKMFDNKLRK
jgi:hypothetical protein